jgi:phospholipid/cholesterol/gamma-HCH transport system permease protein
VHALTKPRSDGRLEIETDGALTRARVSGEVTIRTVTAIHDRLSAIPSDADLRLDLSDVTRLDTSGAWSLTCLRTRLEAGGGHIDFDHATPQTASLMDTVAEALARESHEDRAEPPRTLADTFEDVGRTVAEAGSTLMGYAGFLGLFLHRLARSILRPRDFRLTSLVHHCQEVGLNAVPIVALMAFLIGVVLAFQGAVQLRQFGAEVFVVDLIAVSILRELGILLTAIIVAGRTASAFTAAIGSMKMREEIDAMRTLGLDIGTVLFVPRILALFLMLPILGLVANFAGIFGGALMSWIELGISPQLFQSRLIDGGNLTHLTIGLVKAPVFAVIIGVIGCYRGMQVEGNASSLGRETSRSVVAAIFAVIVADALFSIFFAELGV